MCHGLTSTSDRAAQPVRLQVEKPRLMRLLDNAILVTLNHGSALQTPVCIAAHAIPAWSPATVDYRCVR